MTAQAHRLSIGIGITYLLSEFHDVWWKTDLAIIFLKFQPFSCLWLPTVQCPFAVINFLQWIYTHFPKKITRGRLFTFWFSKTSDNFLVICSYPRNIKSEMFYRIEEKK